MLTMKQGGTNVIAWDEGMAPDWDTVERMGELDSGYAQWFVGGMTVPTPGEWITLRLHTWYNHVPRKAGTTNGEL